MHKKTLSGVMMRRFARMEASKSNMTNYIYGFAAVISRQNTSE